LEEIPIFPGLDDAFLDVIGGKEQVFKEDNSGLIRTMQDEEGRGDIVVNLPLVIGNDCLV